ncbi:hypothetical protein M427DRAFT_388925 [Gonapodya prolifera JEL478]|uniref:Uncharacterized protein n=1 Tax=Gonapodya prolifera (strain JEL478) TaxID=1344416 RepID=A0A139A7X9_GONPJ|nr:hypothetical protein M427DRAFT_388925 [Gonapodya prolifera JEL478]|eukprot:KXS12814.1 hypothetical protein M427DRAFT_388925 [Gonapodya prolifera JEL478]
MNFTSAPQVWLDSPLFPTAVHHAAAVAAMARRPTVHSIFTTPMTLVFLFQTGLVHIARIRAQTDLEQASADAEVHINELSGKRNWWTVAELLARDLRKVGKYTSLSRQIMPKPVQTQKLRTLAENEATRAQPRRRSRSNTATSLSLPAQNGRRNQSTLFMTGSPIVNDGTTVGDGVNEKGGSDDGEDELDIVTLNSDVARHVVNMSSSATSSTRVLQLPDPDLPDNFLSNVNTDVSTISAVNAFVAAQAQAENERKTSPASSSPGAFAGTGSPPLVRTPGGTPVGINLSDNGEYDIGMSIWCG